MNRNDDFDKTLASWLHRQAPSQAPDRVLDAALERVAVQSQKRGWLQSLIGETPMAIMTRTAAVTAVVAIAAFIGFQFGNLSNDNLGNSPSPSASVQATPSSPIPNAAGLVFRLFAGTEAGQVHAVTVLDDGRVISSGVPGTGSPIVERRLTAAGVQLVRDELDATGLTDVSADYLPVPNPGAEPPPYGGAGPSLEVGQPTGEPTVITWFLFGDTEEDYVQPQPEAEALEELYLRLTTLETWLPASAWADATPAPYEAIDYRITILEQDWGGSLEDLPVESSTVVWPLEPGIDAFGQVTTEGFRCAVASAADATAVRQSLQAAGATASDQQDLSFMLGDRANSRVLTVTLDPILPLDESGCEGAVGCLDAAPDVEALIEFQDGTRDDAVACFGNAPLTFDANWVGGGVADCPTAPEPAWLACSAFSLRPVGDTSKVGAPQLSVAVDPATSPLPEPGTDVRVTGHFDDAAAQTCRDTEPEPGAETPAPTAEIIERCRNTFVITAVAALEL